MVYTRKLRILWVKVKKKIRRQNNNILIATYNSHIRNRKWDQYIFNKKKKKTKKFNEKYVPSWKKKKGYLKKIYKKWFLQKEQKK